MKKRFFKPDINKWKYEDNKSSGITDDDKDTLVKSNFKFFNWQISFTKNVVQAAFILFLIGNFFVMALIAISFYVTGTLMYIDTYMTCIFEMLSGVVAGYIIKSATENSCKIILSVISDFIERKYGTKIDTNFNSNSISGDNNTTIIVGDEPSYEEKVLAELKDADINYAPNDEDDPMKDIELNFGNDPDLKEGE